MKRARIENERQRDPDVRAVRPAVPEALMNVPRLRDRDRRRIAGTLPPLRNGVDLTDVLKIIEMARNAYWDDVDFEKKYGLLVPKLCSKTWRDFLRVRSCAVNLLGAIESLGVNSRDKLEALLRKASIPEKTCPALVDFESYIALIGHAAQSFRPAGRPRKFALYTYAAILAFIYANATGSKPRRRYNDYKRYEDGAEQLPFFAACMTAAGVAKYPARIIRQVLKRKRLSDWLIA